jgi:pyruvate-formate lyase-activating enzyme
MLAFYPRFIRTFEDLPGHVSLLIHAWNGCNLRCFGCHNYDELIAKKPEGHLTAEQALERIASSGGLFDAVLFSGGEFLLNNGEEIESFLRRVRSVFSGKIIILTNGSYPRKMRRLLEHDWIDGVHLDLKLPFHLLDPEEDREVFKTVLGTVPSERFCRDILESVEIVIRHNSAYSQVRTVCYPMLSEEFFEHIASYINDLKLRFGSAVPYRLNPFHPPQADWQNNAHQMEENHVSSFYRNH